MTSQIVEEQSKNYKAEIENFRNTLYTALGLIAVPPRTVDIYFEKKIKSLFRDIAKEALPNEIPESVNDGGIFEQEKRGYINGFNNARSEILSNIEKVIK